MGWPIDTAVSELLQTPLEWLGYEIEYLNIGKVPLPPVLPERFAGVIVDGEILIPSVQEHEVAAWLLEVKRQGRPLLFVGGFPFSREDVVTTVAEALGLRGTFESVPGLSEVTMEKVDTAITGYEVRVQPKARDFMDMRAPEGAKVVLSLKARNAEGTWMRYDPVFTTSWGGMWLDPFLAQRASADSSNYYVDPYALLAEWLRPLGIFPAPDTSTRDGRRIFYSHIDGDGFASVAEFKGHPVCAELVRDRVLKVFPMPVTVSIIESEIRGDSARAKVDREPPDLVELAREIYRLPNVQVASHSYSHPYIWEPLDPNPGLYPEPCLAMKNEPRFPALNLEREITGSVKYINETLLPEGKRCDLFLWSGNCRPGPAALRTVRELGLENLNGGNTIISRRYPGMAGIAPRTIEWDGELQVYASNQNEFMYANGFTGPFFGGFADVIDTFERTETPRRLKPVNVYYHFYSATYLSSLRALEKIYHWCAGQKLHNMTALEFTKMSRDSRNTRVIQLAPLHWKLVNEGRQRTFRLPAALGQPDLARSRGVAGWVTHGDQMFIHTTGSAETELVLTGAGRTSGKPHPYLVESSAEVKWQTFSPTRLELEARDLRPIDVIFGGLTPGLECQVTVNSASGKKSADASGQISLTLPAHSRITLTVPADAHAKR